MKEKKKYEDQKSRILKFLERNEREEVLFANQGPFDYFRNLERRDILRFTNDREMVLDNVQI